MEGTAGESTDAWSDNKCVFCKQDIEDPSPKLLPCFHSACSTCIVSDASERIRCPVCMQESRCSDIIDNFFLRESQSVAGAGSDGGEQQPTCSNCDDNVPADSFCNDCMDWLCPACVQAHQRVRVTKDHVICPRSEVSSEQRGNVGQRFLFCPTHKQEPLKLFCETCDTLTCRDCQLSGHRDHRYQFVSEACTAQKQQIHHLLQQLQQRRTHLEANKEASLRVYRELSDREQFIREGIKQFAMKFISEIGQRSRQLVRELHALCGQKKVELTGGHRQVQTSLARMEHSLQFATSALETGSDLALLYSKRLLLTQLRGLQAPAVPPAPSSNMVDVRFVYENTSLVNYIRGLGTLVVGSQQAGFNRAGSSSSSPASPATTGNAGSPHNVAGSQQQQPQHLPNSQLQASLDLQRMSQQLVAAQQHVTSSSSQTFRQQNANLWNLLEKGQPPANPITQQNQFGTSSTASMQGGGTYNHRPANTYQSLSGLHNGTRHPQQQQQHHSHHQQQQQVHQHHLQHPHQQSQQQHHPHHHQQSHHPPQYVQPQPQQYPNQHLSYRSANAVLSQMLSNNGVKQGGQPAHAAPTAHAGVVGSSSSSGRTILAPSVATSLSIVRSSASPVLTAQLNNNNQQSLQQQSLNIVPNIEIVRVTPADQTPSLQLPPPPQYPGRLATQKQLLPNILSRSNTLPLSHYPQQGSSHQRASGTSGGGVRVCSSPSVTTGLDVMRPAVGAFPGIQHHRRESSGSHAGTPSPSPSPSGQTWGAPSPHSTSTSSSVPLTESQCSPESAKKEKVTSTDAASYGLLETIKREKGDEEPEEEMSLDKTLVAMCQTSVDTLMENIRKETAEEAATAAAAGATLATSLLLGQDKPMQADSSSSPDNVGPSVASPIDTKEDGAGAVLMLAVAATAEDDDDVELEIIADHQRVPKEPSAFVDLTLGDDFPMDDNTPMETSSSDLAEATLPQEPEQAMEKEVVERTRSPEQDTALTEEGSSLDTEAHAADGSSPPSPIKSSRPLASLQEDDPNDDWCSVCRDGGDLLCCNKCPRVFHLTCHVPMLPSSAMESDAWQCCMCQDLSPASEQKRRQSDASSMDEQHSKLCQRILLELFCHDASPPFHEPVPRKDVPDYYKVIQRPMDLDTMKLKLLKIGGDGYRSVKEFVADLRLIFRNCYVFNEKESEVYAAGKTVESYMEDLVRKYFPWVAPSVPVQQQPPLQLQEERASSPHGSSHSSTRSRSSSRSSRKRKRPRVESDDSGPEQE